jgi:hypothetical protein
MGTNTCGRSKGPNSFSIRTIECLRNITKAEAEVFARVANFVFTYNNDPFIFKGDNYETLVKNDFSFDEVLILIDIGLLQAKTDIGLIYGSLAEDSEMIFDYGRISINAKTNANTIGNKIPLLVLTRAGKELLKLLSTTPINAYIDYFYAYLQKMRFIVERNFHSSK